MKPTYNGCACEQNKQMLFPNIVDDGIDFTNKCKAFEKFSQVYLGGTL
jgi:hypothetical protein